MATTTTNYHLKKPASGDFYNIADFNDNADLIDGQMKANAQAAQNAMNTAMSIGSAVTTLQKQAVYTLTAQKSGSVFALTGTGLPTTGLVSCLFVAPADFKAGNRFTVNGVSYTTVVSNGDTLADEAFVEDAVVPVVLDPVGQTVNFKSAGRKLTLSANSCMMAACFTANGQFTAPMTGSYRVTCIGRGGDGGNGNYSPGSYALNGAGGGAGGAVQSVADLQKGQTINVTVAGGHSSFGAFATSMAGQDGVFTANQGGTTALIAGGTAGTASGGTVLAGTAGTVGEAANMGKAGDSNDPSYGGNGGAYPAASCPLLPTVGGVGGCYTFTAAGETTSRDGDGPNSPSAAGLFPYGAGGGGGMFYPSKAYLGGKGGSGAVIIEYIL